MEYVKVVELYKNALKKKPADYRLILIITRFIIRDTIVQLNQVFEDNRYFSRQNNLLRAREITAPFLDAKITQIKASIAHLEKVLAEMGEFTIAFADRWQECGATFDDLCDLIGRPHHVTKKLLYGENSNTHTLGSILAIAGLDYYDNGSGFYEYTQDGPFSHATKEFMIYQMLHTEHGAAAAHEAFISTFPELWDKRMYISEDDFGDKVLVDKDGIPVEYLRPNS